MDKLFEILVTIQQSQNNILNRIASIESKLETSRGEQQTCPHSAVYSALVKFKADKKVVDDKACQITWVGIGEKETDAETHAFDTAALKEVIVSSGEDDLMAELESGRVNIRRHPKVVNNRDKSRPRIIKIGLASQQLRDKLLFRMRSGRRSLTQCYVHSYARPDYTREEIEYDRALRIKAGKLNSQEGKLTYVVRDLAIHKLKFPRELPASGRIEIAPGLSQTTHSSVSEHEHPSTAGAHVDTTNPQPSKSNA